MVVQGNGPVLRKYMLKYLILATNSKVQEKNICECVDRKEGTAGAGMANVISW